MPPSRSPSRPSPLPLRVLLTVLKTLLVVLLMAALLAAWSVLIEPRWVARRDIAVQVPDWRGPAGLKVAVASDWHIGHEALKRVMTIPRANAIVDEINAAQPDVILLPGDFMSGRGEDGTTPEQIAAVLGRLKARYGVYAVLGNHDWWTHGGRFNKSLRAAGITVLLNQAVPLPGTPLWVVGIGDRVTAHDLPRIAAQQLPAGAQALVLMHDPASARELPAIPGLTVAGHTHGGQVWIPFYGSAVAPHGWPHDQTHGWVDVGRQHVYITSGLGVSIYPVRFNMRPEWVMFTMDAAPR
ncbi:MAG: metallophosphoesterase [Mitsuaria chitosanitabida]|uniref:metallophosphoesterase n=1 Tax=Roseateles chitosanitabidus TaxID=65048 RepID=UPI001B156405|nr:metallophosphoesterase [Roseateles chitosanitabidus]MBO9685245.1 metallophosphoesterase [Roseateles chitosanitabidus]